MISAKLFVGCAYKQVNTLATACTSSVAASNRIHHGFCPPSPPLMCDSPSGSATPAVRAARKMAPHASVLALKRHTSVVRPQSLT
jgi:hypothetical protein